MNTSSRTAAIRLVFADEGAFHSETVQVPSERIAQYERLIDLLREDESVTRHLYLDLSRLVSAHVAEEGA